MNDSEHDSLLALLQEQIEPHLGRIEKVVGPNYKLTLLARCTTLGPEKNADVLMTADDLLKAISAIERLLPHHMDNPVEIYRDALVNVFGFLQGTMRVFREAKEMLGVAEDNGGFRSSVDIKGLNATIGHIENLESGFEQLDLQYCTCIQCQEEVPIGSQLLVNGCGKCCGMKGRI